MSLAVSDRSKIPLTCDISRVVYTWIIDVNQGIGLPRREPAILPEFSLAERMAAMGPHPLYHTWNCRGSLESNSESRSPSITVLECYQKLCV